MPEALSRRDLAAYGVLALPLAFGGLPLYIHAPDFYAAMHGVPLAALGLSLAWLRLLDGAFDPICGWLGDRWPAARGTMICAGAALLGAGVTGLFSAPRLPALAWFCATMALASLGHSLISVQLLTVGGLWQRAPADKARISTLREGFGLIGLIFAAVLPEVLAPLLGCQGAMLTQAAVLAITLVTVLPVFLRWLGRTRLELQPRPGTEPEWKSLFPLFLVSALVLLSAAFPAALFLMVSRDLLRAEDWSGLFLLTYLLAALPGAALAGRLARRHPAARIWCFALACSVAGFALALSLGPGERLRFLLICATTGFCLGADLVMPPAILSARIEAARAEAVASRAHAVLGFLSRAALAVAGTVAFPLLEFAGFRPSQTNDASALEALLLLYAGVPIALRLGAVAALVFLLRRNAI